MATGEFQSITQRDGRKHDRKTQEAIRLMAVERIQEGEDVASVMASYGLCRTMAYKWLAKARGEVAENVRWPHVKARAALPNCP